jgi:Ran GTPase-activating protein (RanGAP) involved in mRNA processing and transport
MKNISLEEMYLSANKIEYEFFIAILNSLEKHPTMKELDLSDNNIGQNFDENMMPNLENMVLQVLSLRKNKIETNMFFALLNGLEDNTILEELNLKYNNIGKTLVETTAQPNFINNSLNKLNLGGNEITGSLTLDLKNYLECFQNLQILHVNKNPLGNKGVENIMSIDLKNHIYDATHGLIIDFEKTSMNDDEIEKYIDTWERKLYHHLGQTQTNNNLPVQKIQNKIPILLSFEYIHSYAQIEPSTYEIIIKKPHQNSQTESFDDFMTRMRLAEKKRAYTYGNYSKMSLKRKMRYIDYKV